MFSNIGIPGLIVILFIFVLIVLFVVLIIKLLMNLTKRNKNQKEIENKLDIINDKINKEK